MIFFPSPSRAERGNKTAAIIFWEDRMTADRASGSIDPKLLEILVCPLTKSTLEYDAEKQELVSRAAKLAYPIRDGIPIMLPEEARKLD
jgi:uncharacterized protein YbaR (Trm112 family)